MTTPYISYQSYVYDYPVLQFSVSAIEFYFNHELLDVATAFIIQSERQTAIFQHRVCVERNIAVFVLTVLVVIAVEFI